MVKTITVKYGYKVDTFIKWYMIDALTEREKNEINTEQTWKNGTKYVPQNFHPDTKLKYVSIKYNTESMATLG